MSQCKKLWEALRYFALFFICIIDIILDKQAVLP